RPNSHAAAFLLARWGVGNRFPLGAGFAPPSHPPPPPPDSTKSLWCCFPVAELHETADKKLWSVSGA
ncbi:MAG: hypothetical protein OXH66_12700, partial [Gemmatimonadetes bacterium]|nr:hypothetical protein [Gemmatimonadota bacterium]